MTARPTGFAENLLLATDSYKATHWLQYPPGTERVYSYFESRGGRFAEVVFFGLQYLLDRYLAGPVVTADAVDEAEAFWAEHFGNPGLFHRAGWEHVLGAHGGRLPVEIRAVAEGTAVPTRNVLFTIENTDPACFWLPGHLETLLVQLWYPCTVATQSRELRRLVAASLERTGDPTLVETRVHDFGFRGVSSVESAAIGAAAHLTSFTGTDTVAGCRLLRDHYGAGMAGFSIPAMEHSTVTAWGREREAEAFRHTLEEVPTGAVSCVSDSWDVFRACREIWGDTLKDRVLGRDGTVVVRPDSGEPTATVPRVLETLGAAFGTTLNEKGYRVLPPQLRVIQGDGMDFDSLAALLDAVVAKGWSADNLVFGMGGALLQRLHRDTQHFALKCSEVTVEGRPTPVWKDPATDPGKRSKAGRLRLERTGAGFETRSASPGAPDELATVFRNGEVVLRHDLASIRKRASL